VTCERSELSATLKPPVGAAALSVTVPVIVPPPYAGLGTTVNPVRVVALAVRLEGCELATVTDGTAGFKDRLAFPGVE